MIPSSRLAGVTACVALCLLAVGCSPGASAPAPTAPAASAPAASAPAASKPAAAPAAPAPAGSNASAPAGKPELPTTPVVQLKVGALPLSAWAPHYVAQEKGYFKEVGLDVEFFITGNVNEQLPAITQGQLQVGACASSAGCFNALNRRTDLKIVADLASAGKTEKSKGSSAIVVRKDLWDNGTIREPKDLVGYTMWNIAGPGSAHHAQASHWMLRLGLDPRSFEWPQLQFPEQYAAMQNKGIEVGIQTEPLLAAGLANGVHQIMVTTEDMDPNAQVLYLMYWSGIENMGPMVGERFMVAFLRGARDYINAFEYGVDQDQIIDILTKNTVLKDASLYRQIKYSYLDPNGVLTPKSLEADAELFRELGVINTPIELGPMFDDKYRQFAVQYLGEYRPPR
jgi:NitT/TauT family transport system substrate-binding protein